MMRTVTRACALVVVLGLAACGGGGSGGTKSGSVSSPSRSASSAAGTSASFTVPAVVERGKDGVVVLVPVTVHQKSVYFVLDSGATSTVLDAAFARSLGLHTVGAPTTTKTIGCTIQSSVSVVDNWQLGSRPLPAAKLITQDLGFGAATVDGKMVAGLLGADVQSSAGIVRVDYAHGSVVFGASAASGGQQVHVRVVEQGKQAALIAPVTIGRQQLSMVVDTGASHTTLAQTVANQLQLPSAGAPVKANAAGCPVTVQPVRLTGAKIGSVSVPAATVDSSQHGSPYGQQIPGLFGSDLLSTFGVVTLDYRRSTLTLGA